MQPRVFHRLHARPRSFSSVSPWERRVFARSGCVRARSREIGSPWDRLPLMIRASTSRTRASRRIVRAQAAHFQLTVECANGAGAILRAPGQFRPPRAAHPEFCGFPDSAAWARSAARADIAKIEPCDGLASLHLRVRGNCAEVRQCVLQPGPSGPHVRMPRPPLLRPAVWMTERDQRTGTSPNRSEYSPVSKQRHTQISARGGVVGVNRDLLGAALFRSLHMSH